MRLKISRPSLSVPSRCPGEGGRSPATTFCASGSYGAISGASSAAVRKTSRMSSPAAIDGRRSARPTATLRELVLTTGCCCQMVVIDEPSLNLFVKPDRGYILPGRILRLDQSDLL